MILIMDHEDDHGCGDDECIDINDQYCETIFIGGHHHHHHEKTIRFVPLHSAEASPETWTLKIQRPQLADAGEYECQVVIIIVMLKVQRLDFFLFSVFIFFLIIFIPFLILVMLTFISCLSSIFNDRPCAGGPPRRHGNQTDEILQSQSFRWGKSHPG